MINEEIRDKEVRLVGTEGEQFGVVPLKQAMTMAAEKNLDLVKIAPQAAPPVCKIMDYGKYKFELAKKEKEIRRNAKTVDIKEIRFSPNIDDNDFNTKVGHALKFLQSGDKVKVTVRFRGRELSHTSFGEILLTKFAESVSDCGNVDKKPKLEGKSMTMFVVPLKK